LFEVRSTDVQQFAFPTSPFFSAVEFCSRHIERDGVLPCPEGLTDSKLTIFAILVSTPGGM
ncbi:MAG: hypothetical protein WBY73_02385, partial [Candidatus Acidiferrales bacterium]